MANSRVLKNKGNKVTWNYKKGTHNGIDIVGTGSTLDYIVAHSDGTVVQARNNYKTTDTSGGSYGNYVLIRHSNGMYTLYAHMRYGSVTVKVGQKVKKWQTLGYMGNTGYAFGAHLHFEVRDKNNNMIDPTKYINADLPSITQTTKSIIDLANEVIAGKHGVGEARKKSLGSLYDEVQAKVNEILGKKTTGNKKSNETIANEVIAGKWGNGAKRKQKLENAGYNFNAIQAIVNKKLLK